MEIILKYSLNSYESVDYILWDSIEFPVRILKANSKLNCIVYYK